MFGVSLLAGPLFWTLEINHRRNSFGSEQRSRAQADKLALALREPLPDGSELCQCFGGHSLSFGRVKESGLGEDPFGGGRGARDAQNDSGQLADVGE